MTGKRDGLDLEQRAWGWYDWATSGFYTTVLTVLFGPLMITVAGRAAGCDEGAEDTCSRAVSVLGVELAAGSLPSYLTSLAAVLSAFLLPLVGALVDRSGRKKWHMAWFGWGGAFFCSLLFFLQDDRWQLGAVAVVVSSILAGCSMVSYYAILVDVSDEDARHQVALRGSALGYLGGGLLLVVNLGLVLGHEAIGIGQELAVRLSLLSAAVWWAVFILIPLRRLRNRPPRNVVPHDGNVVQRSFGQLWVTFKEMRAYPVTLTFLLAYLFYNDGMQTVIYSASIYGAEQLQLGEEVLIVAVLLIQFVAFGSAIAFSHGADRLGAYRILVLGTAGWMAIVSTTAFLPAGRAAPYLVAAFGVAIVMGATLALSRSFFSLLIPRGREGEYFAFYSAVERGTSWFGVLVFGLVFQFTGSYRPAVLSMVIFFVLGLAFLLRVDPRRGIAEAGNRIPPVV